MLVLLFAPHYSILVMLVSYFVQICGSPLLLIFHLSIIYSLTFLACCSLIVCVVRDPGAIRVGEGVSNQAADVDNEHLNDDEEDNTMDLRGALLMPVTTKSSSEDDDFNAPHKWCRKCWAPKPERTHHCSVCGRCVLKMGRPLKKRGDVIGILLFRRSSLSLVGPEVCGKDGYWSHYSLYS